MSIFNIKLNFDWMKRKPSFGEPKSQQHCLLIMLLNAYPKSVSTWDIQKPINGIMQAASVKRHLQNKGLIIHREDYVMKNMYKRTISCYSYRLAPHSYQNALELEKKFASKIITD